MRVLIIGANGLTGTRLLRRLSAGPHDPVAMIRDPGQQPKFAGMGVPTRVGDLEEPLDPVLEGMDAIIFTAGSGSKTGPEKTLAVDRDGAIRTIAAMEAVGIARLVMLSSLRADPASEGHPLSPYLRAKGIADEHIRRSKLNYTIVRPGRLTEEEGTGEVELAPSLDHGGSIPREDVAAVLAGCLEETATRRKTFDLLSGSTPVVEALRGL